MILLRSNRIGTCLLISKPTSFSKIMSFHELFLLLNQEKLPLQSYRDVFHSPRTKALKNLYQNVHWFLATEKKAKTGVWDKTAIGSSTTEALGLKIYYMREHLLQPITKRSGAAVFLIWSYICELYDLRLLVWTFGSSSMRTCQKEFILSYLCLFTVSSPKSEFRSWKKTMKFLFGPFQKTAAPDSFIIEWRRRFVI